MGRQRELAELGHGLADLRAGAGRLYLVSGEAGIGKTRLIEELTVRAPGTVTLKGHTWEGRGAPEYRPWGQVVRAYIERGGEAAREDLGPSSHMLAEIVPELRRFSPGTAPTSGGDRERARFFLFDAFRAFLRRAARRHSLVVVLDDLHWADGPTLALLGAMARELDDIPALFVGICRDADGPDWSRGSWAEITRYAHRLRLEGLNEAEIRSLLEGRLGCLPSARLVASLRRMTGGNPFFVDETLRTLADCNLPPEHLLDGDIPVPDGVRGIVRRRLAQLHEETRAALDVASVLGSSFDVSLLGRVCDAPASELLERLDEATGASFVRAAPGPERHGFAHDLVRQTLYADLPAPVRLDLHARVGELLHRTHARGSEVAHHFRRADPDRYRARAVEALGRAGREALDVLAHESAVQHFEEALGSLELLEGGEPDSKRCELLVGLGEALSGAREVERARAVFAEAVELARRLGDRERLARTALASRWAWSHRDTLVEHDPVRLLREGLEAVGEGNPRLRVRLLSALCEVLLFEPDALKTREELSREALDIARELDDDALLHALWARKFVLDVRRIAEWDELADEGLALAERRGDPELLVEWHDFRLSISLWMGDMQRVDLELKLLRRLVERAPHAVYVWHLRGMEAMRALDEGRFEDAERLAGEVLTLGAEIGDDIAAQYAGAVVFAIRDHLGRLDEISPLLEEHVGAHPEIPAWRCALAYAYARTGRASEAREQLERLAGRDFSDFEPDYNWLVAVACLVGACASLGDVDRASVLYEMLLPHAGHNVVVAGNGASLGSASLPLAVAAATAGHTEDAVRHFEAAIAMNDRMANLPWAARARHGLAELLLRTGEPDRGAALLREALTVYRRLGMETFAAEAEALLQEDEAAESTRTEGYRRFEREGEFWTVTFDGDTARIKDSKGMRYLSVLLGRPGAEVHVLDLVGLAASGAPPGPSPSPEDALRLDGGDAAPVLDAEAKRAFRERIEALHDEVEEAETFNDPERAVRARAELEAIEEELTRAVGLGGRDRKPTAQAERARVNATRAIRSALDRIADALPGLGEHLVATISTGRFCSYRPDPSGPFRWCS